MCDTSVNDENHRFYSNGILSHNSVTTAIYCLWVILFNIDKNALVLGNKRKTAVEILDKAKKIFTELPYFLRPGIYKWNEGEIVLDNGCRCDGIDHWSGEFNLSEEPKRVGHVAAKYGIYNQLLALLKRDSVGTQHKLRAGDGAGFGTRCNAFDFAPFVAN